MAESLSDKLKALGVQTGSANLQPRPKPAKNNYSIDAVIPGQVVHTSFGETYKVEAWYGTDYQHGTICFNPATNLKILSDWGRISRQEQSEFSRFIFLDTETTGLGGGTGTYAFLVGLGHLTPNGFHLIQLLMRDPLEEPAMLALLSETLGPFAGMVTYNGKSFDAPLLNTRHVLNGFTSPLGDLDHLDLLPLARRLYKNRLPSRRLGDLEWQICGVARAQEEVPGFLIPQIYFDYLSSGDARPLAGVLYHNAMDILSLAALFQHVACLLADPLGYTTPESLDLIAIARLYEDLGQYETAVELYEASLQLGMPETFFIQTLDRYAELYRRHGEWEKTVHLWEKAAERGQVSACQELAKFFEHQQRDYARAIYWTDEALKLAGLLSGYYSRLEWIKTLTYRRERLARKLKI